MQSEVLSGEPRAFFGKKWHSAARPKIVAKRGRPDPKTKRARSAARLHICSVFAAFGWFSSLFAFGSFSAALCQLFDSLLTAF